MNRFNRKVTSILFSVIFLGEIHSSIAMDDEFYEGNNSLHLSNCDILKLKNDLKGEPVDFILPSYQILTQIARLCKEKNKKLFKISSNGGWLIVNNDLSPFRTGSEDKYEHFKYENFYYFMNGSDRLGRCVNCHPLQLNSHNERIYKLPIEGNESLSLIVCYAPGWYGSGVKTVDKNGKWFTKLLLEDKKNHKNKYIVSGIDVGAVTEKELNAFKLEQSDDDSKTYLFPTKNLFFLEDIRTKGEEDEGEKGVKKWFEKNEKEIRSYANKK